MWIWLAVLSRRAEYLTIKGAGADPGASPLLFSVMYRRMRYQQSVYRIISEGKMLIV